MEVLRDGTFTYNIDSKQLSSALRPIKNTPRNSDFLIKSEGMVGRVGALETIQDFTDLQVDTSMLTGPFPYPQVFVFQKYIILCDYLDIYEVSSNGALTHMFGPVTPGIMWSGVAFHDYVYLSNAMISVVRNPVTHLYSYTLDLPRCTAMCNLNGQVIVGSPEAFVQGLI